MAVKKWRGKWVVDFKYDGQRVRRVSPVQTKRGALEYEAELRLASSTSGSSSETTTSVAEPPTLGEFAPEWLTTYVVVNNKPSERYRKEGLLRVHLVPFFGNLRLDEITPQRIEEFKGHQLDLDLANSTINRHLAVLGTLLRTAVDWELLRRAPKITKLSESDAEFDWLRPEEAHRLLIAAEAFPAPRRTLLLLALRTGMRRGEVMGLHWDEVDLADRRLTVRYNNWRGRLGPPKNGKVRAVPLARDLADALADWRRQCPGPYVFPRRDGQLMTRAYDLNVALDQVLEAAALRHIRFHDLRHSFASHLVLKGRPLREVQVLMGHYSITMTERYAHVGDQQLQQAIDVLDSLGADAASEQRPTRELG